MWTPTVELDALQKLDILENEWLPIVIEMSYQEAIKKSESEEFLEMLENAGFLPIWRTEPVEKVFDEVKTFEEYINKRLLIQVYKRIRKYNIV